MGNTLRLLSDIPDAWKITAFPFAATLKPHKGSLKPGVHCDTRIAKLVPVATKRVAGSLRLQHEALQNGTYIRWRHSIQNATPFIPRVVYSVIFPFDTFGSWLITTGEPRLADALSERG